MAPPYAIGDVFGTYFPHHDSLKALWDAVWRFQCSKSIYPFNDSDIKDFEPIIDLLIKVGSRVVLSPGRD